MHDLSLPFLAGDSRLAGLMREADWTRSPLGAPATWPQSLRSVVDVLLGSAFPMFVAWGPQLAMLYNDAYADILGAKHPRSLGAPFEDVWGDIHADIMPFVRRALGGEAFYVEDLPLRMRRHGFDEDTWFTFSYSPVRDESGEIAAFFCACVETTKTVVAQQQLRARQEWLTALFEQAPGFAAVLRGPTHVFEMVNESYRQITGHRPLVGLPFAQALPEVAPQGFSDLLEQVYASGKPHVGRSVPVSLSRGPGEPAYDAYVDFVYQPMLDAEGRVEAIFVQGHDVTDQHRAQEQLREADRQKDEFLATLAHELRNPLAPVRLAASLLQRPGLDDPGRQRAAAIVERQVAHMARLLDDLIDIARITRGRLVLQPADVPLADIVEGALETVRPMAQARRHELDVQLEGGARLLHVDPVRMTQVLSNLLNNALKYTDPGGRIRLEARAQADGVRLAVEDNGIGLDPAALGSLFVMFSQREEALSRADGGLGIGLALVRGLVELHGGTVSARSEGRGHGSRFEVNLPASVLRGASPGAATAAEANGASRTVLVADDNADAMALTAEVLRLAGYEVVTASDGAQALQLAEAVHPEVLVLDLGMPGLSGYDVARRIRAQPWGAAAVLVAATGWGQLADREKTRDAGFDAHLTKPFTPDDLVATIERAFA